jgi:hypothetical protein
LRRFLILLIALVAASCADDGSVDPSSPGSSSGSTGGVTTAIDPLRPCQTTVLTDLPAPGEDGPATERVSAQNLASASAAVAQSAFACASDVVVVGTSDLERIAMASRLAIALGGPVLLGDATGSTLLAYEIDRLAPSRVWFVGEDVTAEVPAFTEVEVLRGDNSSLAAEINDRVDSESNVTLPAGGGADSLRVALAAFESGAGIVGSSPTGAPPAPLDPVPFLRAGTGTFGFAWLVDGASPPLALVAAATAIVTDGLMVLVDGADLLAGGASDELAAAEPRKVQLLGGGPNASWQLDVLLGGAEQLPGGGFVLFPGKRLIAIYGNPNTTSLGILGEQDVEASVVRAKQLAAQYQTGDGIQAIPTFEIIATVAAGNPGDDGDYSNEMPIELLRTWVDVAGREGVYVILDLQPGRTDFLTQAKLYEELLLEPHVGLALDPEWRLLPDELPLRQIGHVEAAEVNEVVDWLAALVRDNHLPQKILLLHQFEDQMLRDRDLIKTPPELGVVIQMDGQGTIPDKYSTWNRITNGWEGFRWDYGWKNFYDEDIPGPIPPSEVLELTPAVVYVSYQ